LRRPTQNETHRDPGGWAGILPRAAAGEKFLAWLKSCKPKPLPACLKKFILHKTIVKSGENVFLPDKFLVGTGVAKRTRVPITTETVGFYLPVGAGGTGDCDSSAWLARSAVQTQTNHEKN
jgi:hypothetical protein